MKNDSIILIIALSVISVPIALGCSRLIDGLYTRNRPLLTYPEGSDSSKRRRLFLLAAAIFFCGKMLLRGAAGTATIFLVPAALLLLIITTTDFEQELIFDATTAPLALLGLGYAAFLSWETGAPGELLSRLLAAGASGLAFLLLAILTRGGIGGGDVKLMAALGLWLGPDRLLSVSAVGFVLGGLAALFLLVVKKKSRKATFAYGPYFALTALVTLLAGG